MIMNKDIRLKIKSLLIEIPYRDRVKRELNALTDELGFDKEDIKKVLNEMCDKKILIEKVEYKCPLCSYMQKLSKESLDELIEISGSSEYIDCEECYNNIYIKHNNTGFIYYDVLDEDKLNKWF